MGNLNGSGENLTVKYRAIGVKIRTPSISC